MLAATKPLSPHNYVCCDKLTFVATNTCLSRQKYACRDKHNFVATKKILVAAPANDRGRLHYEGDAHSV